MNDWLTFPESTGSYTMLNQNCQKGLKQMVSCQSSQPVQGYFI